MSHKVKSSGTVKELAEMKEVLRVFAATSTISYKGGQDGNTLYDLVVNANGRSYTLAVYPAGATRKLALSSKRASDGGDYQLLWEIK